MRSRKGLPGVARHRAFPRAPLYNPDVRTTAFSIVTIALLVACGTARAADETTYDFQGSVPNGTKPQNLTTVEVAAQGMYVKTDADGIIALPVPPRHVDSAVITVTNVQTPRIAIIWQDHTLKEGEFYQQNVTLPTGDKQRVNVDLDGVPEWNGMPSAVALAFPAGAEVLIQKIEWKEYTTTEKIAARFKSFWTPDTFQMYSINFLWGPLLSGTEEGRLSMFDDLPPRAWSATRLFYVIFAIAAVVALIVRFSDRVAGPARMKKILLAAGVALWILFDARMTQEIVGYAVHDWSSYVLKPAGERTLRTHVTLYDILSRLDALLGDDERYVLVTREGTPFFSNVRYVLYPAKPVGPPDAGDTKAWIVLGIPGIDVKNGALTLPDGTVLSPAGTLVERFDDSALFFRAK